MSLTKLMPELRYTAELMDVILKCCVNGAYISAIEVVYLEYLVVANRPDADCQRTGARIGYTVSSNIHPYQHRKMRLGSNQPQMSKYSQ